jgi:predicted nucleic acid-binding protein
VARRRGLIPAARPGFEMLLARDFRLSAALIRAVLAESGES